MSFRLCLQALQGNSLQESLQAETSRPGEPPFEGAVFRLEHPGEGTTPALLSKALQVRCSHKASSKWLATQLCTGLSSIQVSCRQLNCASDGCRKRAQPRRGLDPYHHQPASSFWEGRMALRACQLPALLLRTRERTRAHRGKQPGSFPRPIKKAQAEMLQ